MVKAQAKEGGSKSELKKQLFQCKQELADRKYRNIENEVRKSSIAFKTVEMAARDLDRYHGALDSALQSYHSIKVREINSIIKEIWQLCYKGGDIDSECFLEARPVRGLSFFLLFFSF